MSGYFSRLESENRTQTENFGFLITKTETKPNHLKTENFGLDDLDRPNWIGFG